MRPMLRFRRSTRRRRPRAGRRRASPRDVPPRPGSAPRRPPRQPSRRSVRPDAARRSAVAAGTSARLPLPTRIIRRPARRASPESPCPRPRRSPTAWRRRHGRSGWVARRRCGIERKAAQPTPIWRWGSSPESQATTIATSAGSDLAWLSNSAIRAILARRAAEPPTSTEVVATSISSTTHLYTPDRQRHARPR